MYPLESTQQSSLSNPATPSEPHRSFVFSQARQGLIPAFSRSTISFSQRSLTKPEAFPPLHEAGSRRCRRRASRSSNLEIQVNAPLVSCEAPASRDITPVLTSRHTYLLKPHKT